MLAFQTSRTESGTARRFRRRLLAATYDEGECTEREHLVGIPLLLIANDDLDLAALRIEAKVPDIAVLVAFVVQHHGADEIDAMANRVALPLVVHFS